jgi:UDP-glucose 4-epimerase
LRVLVTGGAGFIGSHLADACLARGDEVFALDDLSTGSIVNIEHLRRHPRFHVRLARVQDSPLTRDLVDRVDVVYHLAASVGVRLVVGDPARTIENNLQATEAVLSAAVREGKRVLFTSTSEVYGLSTDLPYREDGHLVRPHGGAMRARRRSTSSWRSRTTATAAFR